MTDGNEPSHFINPETNAEIKIAARAVSRGVSTGKVVCLYGSRRQFYRVYLKKIQIDGELKRFRAAVDLAKLQLKQISNQKSTFSDQTKINIFDAHYLMLEDDSLLVKVEKTIEEKKVNAEWAVKIITDIYIANYKSIADEYLRERYIDVEDVTDRLLNALGGGGKSNFLLEKNSIIVAKEIKPSTLIELTESAPKAIVTEIGGWTSHSFILAREINLPAVTGVEGILRRVQTGDEVIVDGFNGQVILHPTENTIKKYNRQATRFQQVESPNPSAEQKKLTTLDGRRITVRANVDFIDEHTGKKLSGASGIGLYRSEFLLNQYEGFPTEQEQIEVYRSVADVVGSKRAGIRTFDINPEQIADIGQEKEKKI